MMSEGARGAATSPAEHTSGWAYSGSRQGVGRGGRSGAAWGLTILPRMSRPRFLQRASQNSVLVCAPGLAPVGERLFEQDVPQDAIRYTLPEDEL